MIAEDFFCTEKNCAIRIRSFRDKKSFHDNAPGREKRRDACRRAASSITALVDLTAWRVARVWARRKVTQQAEVTG
jgi:hypothetical protein